MKRKRAEIHLCAGTPTYASWHRAITRCHIESNKDFPRYGGKGIKVCKRWQNYLNFLSDMGIRPKGMTLDRIDNSKGYSPSNCRWADRKVQAQNRSSSIFVEINGVSKCLLDWSKESGVAESTLYCRYHRGWRGERLISGVKVLMVEIGGETKSLNEWAKQSGKFSAVVYRRYKKGVRGEALIA